MAQSITWLGNTYTQVPAILLPKTGGGTARFTDTTPTTATDSDVAQGKIYIKADGTQSTGTATGGGGSVNIWQDQNGYVVLNDDAQGTQIITPLSVTTNGTYTAQTGNAYNPVTVNVSSGGGTFGVFGIQEFVTKIYDETVALEDTPFAEWTPSTTAKHLQSYITGDPYTVPYDLSVCYCIEWKVVFDPVYLTGATDSARITRYVYIGNQVQTSTPQGYDNIVSENYYLGSNINAIIPQTSYNTIMAYYDTSGTLKANVGADTYGVYVNGLTSSSISRVSSMGVDTFRITPVSPSIYARASASYMSTANMGYLDTTNSTFRIVANLYRMTITNNVLNYKTRQLVDMFNNGI